MPKPSLKELLDKYAPRFRFHSKEKYHPCSLEDYIANSRLFVQDTKIPLIEHLIKLAGQLQADDPQQRLAKLKTILLAKIQAVYNVVKTSEGFQALATKLNNALTQQDRKSVTDLLAVLQAHQNQLNFQLTYDLFVLFSEEEWRGDLEGELRLQPDDEFAKQQQDYSDEETPIYANAFERTIRLNGQKKEVYALTYAVTYAYNKQPLLLPCINDWHYADIEHVTLYVDKKPDGTPGKVIMTDYVGHSPDEESIWKASDDMILLDEDDQESSQGKHPLVFVAEGSHAMRPKDKTWLRILCCANDHTESSEYSVHWKPQRIVTDTRFFTEYPSLKMGGSRINANKGFFTAEAGVREKDSPRSTSTLMSCFGLLFGKCCQPGCYEKVKDTMMTETHEILETRLYKI